MKWDGTEKYPFEKIRAAADMASSMRKDDLPKITKLRGQDSAVRYWGALGSLMQGKSGGRARQRCRSQKHCRILLPLSGSSRPEALGKHSDPKKDLAERDQGPRRNRRTSQERVLPLQLLAMNAVDHLDDKARSLLSRIQSMPRTPTEVDKRFQGYVGRLVDTTIKELKGEK